MIVSLFVLTRSIITFTTLVVLQLHPLVLTSPMIAAQVDSQEIVTADASTSSDSSEYVAVAGMSQQEKQQLRQLESKAAAKTARDYQHVVWAYGLLWTLFAVYGIFLWRRSANLRRDLDDLQARMTSEKPLGEEASD